MAGEQQCWGLIPAAGTGSRMGGGIPKQYLPLCGATVLEHSLAALLDCDEVVEVVVAVHPDDPHPAHLACFEQARVGTVTGGAERCDSVLAGLDALSGRAGDQDWVLVHDAARPCVAVADIQRLIRRVRECGIGALLATPMVDTIKQTVAGDSHRVIDTLDRSRLWRAQTPQMFRLGQLRTALLQARERDLVVTDEASAMELAGHAVELLPASADNLKVTVPADLALAEWLLSHPDRPRAGGN